jgi:hypothetical protein
MKAASRTLVGAAFVLFGGSLLMGQTVLRADLSGANEVPGVASNAQGQAVFVVYPDRIEFNLSASGFGTDVALAHIHLGFPGVNGPVIANLFIRANQGDFPGRLTGTILPLDVIPNADRGVSNFNDLRNALIGGRTYTNMHTTLAAGGEIRGQNLTVQVAQ